MNIYKKAIVGYTAGLEPNSEADVPVYDLELMVKCLLDQGICEDEEDAEDHICYNASFTQPNESIIIYKNK